MKVLKIVIAILFAHSFTMVAQDINQVNGSGEKTGSWVKYFDNGKVKYEGQFHKGKPMGEFTYYYKKGSVKATSAFSKDGTIAHNVTYYENGSKMAEGKYFNQKKDSVWRYYLDEDNNPLVSTETYVSGALNGESVTYYPDSGEPAEILILKDGIKDGKLIKYFPDGALMTESFYKDGLPEGKFIHYHPDGKIQIEGRYYNGVQAGEWKYFDEDGKPVDKDEFKKQEEVEEIK